MNQNKKSHWVNYSKTILSAASFVSQFRGPKAFNDFVESFYRDAHARIALPLLIKEEIHGFGLALACDFLKENGYEGFVKPDVHLIEICRGVGVTTASSDFGVYKDVIAYCELHGLVPYEFDKLIWLVGSGKFYKSALVVPTSKRDFICLFNKTSKRAR
jgi:thermostable 8-oxoguanine DNA glycosylase